VNNAVAARSERLSIVLQGSVHGFGFRPTIYRLAWGLGLAGWVRKTQTGIEVQVEGGPQQLSLFMAKLRLERPPAAMVTIETVLTIPLIGGRSFEILPDAAASASLNPAYAPS
jgi:hydrogenase maturation protein HypF